MAKNQYKKELLKNNVEEMFIGPFGSSLKNECFVDEEDAYCMVYEQKHAIQKTLDGKNRFVDKNKYYELKRFTIKPGDIIVSCRGTIGETFIVPENAPLGIMHPSIMKIRLKPNVYNIEYFNLLLKNRLKDYNKSANGSGIKMAISASELGKEMFPIPPMDEQQKVSKIFLTVDRLIVLRQQQLAKLDELVKARFVEMFGDINVNNKKWMTYPLGELCTIVRGGSPRPIERYLGGTIPWIKIGDATTGENIYLNSTKEYIIQEGVKKSRMIKAGSLIFANCGVSLGFARIITFDGCIHDGWLAMEDIDEKLDKIFLLYSLNQMTEYFRKTAPAGTQPNLNTNIMKMHRQIVPPMEMQKAFISFVKCADRQKQIVQQSLEKLELMKKALMQEYFG